MRDDDEGGFLLFDQPGDGVGARLEGVGLLVWRHVLTVLLGLSGRLQTVLLGQLGFGPVLFKQLEQLDGGLLVRGLGELVYGWWHLQTLLKHGLVALNADVLGPTHKPGQVTAGLNVLANAEVLGPLLEQGVGDFLHFHFLYSQWWWRYLLAPTLLGAGLSLGTL